MPDLSNFATDIVGLHINETYETFIDGVARMLGVSSCQLDFRNNQEVVFCGVVMGKWEITYGWFNEHIHTNDITIALQFTPHENIR